MIFQFTNFLVLQNGQASSFKFPERTKGGRTVNIRAGARGKQGEWINGRTQQNEQGIIVIWGFMTCHQEALRSRTCGTPR